MTDGDVRWITDDNELWMQTRVRVEGPAVDALMVAPGVRSLGMKVVGMPDGELAKLERLESLVTNGGSAKRIDVCGCASLRHLAISHVRGLGRTGGYRVAASTQAIARLLRLDLGSMKGLTGGLSPFLAAGQPGCGSSADRPNTRCSIGAVR